MAWWYWVLVGAAIWYVGAAVAVRKFGYYSEWLPYWAVGNDRESGERDARIKTWAFSPVLLAMAILFVVVVSIFWPCAQALKQFDRFFLKPKE